MPSALHATDVYVIRTATNKHFDDDVIIFSNPPENMRNVWSRKSLNTSLSGKTKLTDPVVFKNTNPNQIVLRYQGILLNALADNGISFQTDMKQDFEVISLQDTVIITPIDVNDIAKRMYVVKIAKLISNLSGDSSTKLEEISDRLKGSDNKLTTTFSEIKQIHSELTVECFLVQYGKGNVQNEQRMSKGRFVNDYFVSEDFDDLFDIVTPKVFNEGGYLNIWLCGPSGYGKTSIVEQLGAYHNKPVIQVNCAVMQNSEQWFGRTRVNSEGTFFEPTSFTKAVQAGDCVIILDEANRCDPEVSNSLLPLLDHRHETEVNGMVIKAGKGIVFALTTNIGPQYAGVSALDAAFINRCNIRINVSAMSTDAEISLLKRIYPTNDEKMTTWLANVCQTLRKLFTSENEPDFQFIDVDVSTRTLLNMGMLANYGLDKNSIINYTVFNHLTPDIQVKVKDRLKLVVGNF